MGSVLSEAAVSDVTEDVEFDNEDVLFPKANKGPEEDDDDAEPADSDEHREEPDADDKDEEDEPDAKLFGDFGELFR